MSEDYPIKMVDPKWPAGPEHMGSKDKFWFSEPNSPEGPEWLFKFPTANTGGHWAEKIAYEIARKMRVLAPRVELAICCAADGEQRRGSITESFTSEYELYHGNQILARMDPNYDRDWKSEYNKHTIERIFAGMDLFETNSFAERCKVKLAGYFILDAVIGNVDRHHENWGILRKRIDENWKGRLAPTFDHASSLGRELLDTGRRKSRELYLRELGIEIYAKRARGAIFTAETDAHGRSPLELIRWCLQAPDYRRFFEKAFHERDFPDEAAVEKIVAKIPDDWMTPVSREFAMEFLHYNCERLREIFC